MSGFNFKALSDDNSEPVDNVVDSDEGDWRDSADEPVDNVVEFVEAVEDAPRGFGLNFGGLKSNGFSDDSDSDLDDFSNEDSVEFSEDVDSDEPLRSPSGFNFSGFGSRRGVSPSSGVSQKVEQDSETIGEDFPTLEQDSTPVDSSNNSVDSGSDVGHSSLAGFNFDNLGGSSSVDSTLISEPDSPVSEGNDSSDSSSVDSAGVNDSSVDEGEYWNPFSEDDDDDSPSDPTSSHTIVEDSTSVGSDSSAGGGSQDSTGEVEYWNPFEEDEERVVYREVPQSSTPVPDESRGLSGGFATTDEERERREVERVEKNVSVYRQGKGGRDSVVESRGAREVLVDGSGRRGRGDRFDSLVKASENLARVDGDKAVGVPVSDGVVYPWRVRKARGRGERGKQKLGLEDVQRFKNFTDRFAVEEVLSEVGGGVDNGRGVTVKDFDLLDFLGRFRYASARQLSNIHGVEVDSVKKRLRKLKGKNFVREYYVFGREPVFVLSEDGLNLVNLSVPLVRPNKISMALFNHTFVVNNTASGLMGGTLNTLFFDDDDFPLKNRVDMNGLNVFGESLIGESEIQSSLARARGNNSAKVFRPELLSRVDSAFTEWEAKGGVSPEFLLGNEFMWTVFPRGSDSNTNYHVPDFVVRRERASDGSPESIAVEVELNRKDRARYVPTLKAFMADRKIYKKVVWVVRGSGQAKVLEEVAKEIGLWQEGRIEVVPILTRNGVFGGRDYWLL